MIMISGVGFHVKRVKMSFVDHLVLSPHANNLSDQSASHSYGNLRVCVTGLVMSDCTHIVYTFYLLTKRLPSAIMKHFAMTVYQVN